MPPGCLAAYDQSPSCSFESGVGIQVDIDDVRIVGRVALTHDGDWQGCQKRKKQTRKLHDGRVKGDAFPDSCRVAILTYLYL